MPVPNSPNSNPTTNSNLPKYVPPKDNCPKEYLAKLEQHRLKRVALRTELDELESEAFKREDGYSERVDAYSSFLVDLAQEGHFECEPMVPRQETEFEEKVILPATGEFEDGWFYRGQLNIVAGSSGAGKSSILWPVLEAYRLGLPAFEHTAAQGEYVVISLDRDGDAVSRTLARLRLPSEARWRCHPIKRSREKEAVKGQKMDYPFIRDLNEFLSAMMYEHRTRPFPDLAFIEGLDMTTPRGRINDFGVVSDYCDELQRLARHWNVALVGSVGAPKVKAKDGYMLTRDTVIGSSAWCRKADTVLVVTLADPKDPNSDRMLFDLRRNGASVVHPLRWDNRGRLVKAEEKLELEAPAGVKISGPVGVETQMIQVIEAQPIGAELPHSLFAWVPQGSFNRHMKNLSKPPCWVGKNAAGKWVRVPNLGSPSDKK